MVQVPLGSRVVKGECIEIVLAKYESKNFLAI